jgi:hypothetical protein
MAELTDAERVYVEALRTVRAKLMDHITGLDDTIAEVEQAAAARKPLPPKERQLESLGTFVKALPDGGQQRRNDDGDLLNIAADGMVTWEDGYPR